MGMDTLMPHPTSLPSDNSTSIIFAVVKLYTRVSTALLWSLLDVMLTWGMEEDLSEMMLSLSEVLELGDNSQAPPKVRGL